MANTLLKPALGSKINFAHPLGRDLQICLLFNEGGGDTVYNSAMMQIGSMEGGYGAKIQGMTPRSPTTGWNYSPEGSVLVFDGTGDWIEMSKVDYILPVKPVTYIVRVCPTNVGGRRDIIGRDRSGYTNIGAIGIYDFDGGKYLFYTGGSGFNSNVVAVANQWTTLSFSWDGTTAIWCVDGKITNKGSFTAASVAGRGFKIGNRYNLDHPYIGLISYAMAYGRALSEKEMIELYAFPYAMFIENKTWLEYGEASGWSNIAKYNGVASADIAKINGVAVADIAKINGVAV